ncbi:Peptide chain release factor subunit 1 [Mycena chlorophos]|uniref:Peptide chain release factor subunit 1 n=1 Tax=Mycena chlorophos TaxID=658473 RepID=A0A8H6RZ67_MYCCL|nr:Peptide chain release factor subunit 1 [Mycena chlorophos]
MSAPALDSHTCKTPSRVTAPEPSPHIKDAPLHLLLRHHDPPSPHANIMSQPDVAEQQQNIQVWKIKKLVKSLESARGGGTSMISLILPPGGQIARTAAMLTQEHGTASQIKSRVNRQSVQSAITSAQQRLKLYNKVPPNGLALYMGTIVTDDGKTKKISLSFEPHKPVNRSLYLCDNKFHTEPLAELFESDARFGFIIMDGLGTLFGMLSGSSRTVLQKLSVALPKKHGRGGQSALRFSRIRDEKRHHYVRKVAELAVQHFVAGAEDSLRVVVTGLVLAGNADFKNELAQSPLFDPRLAGKVVKVVDVSYGGENGFNQAIDLASDALAGVRFLEEKKLIQKYFDEISRDTGKFCYGVDDTLKALELGAVETLIVWEGLEMVRYVLRNAAGEQVIIHAHPNTTDRTKFIDRSVSTGVEMESFSPDTEPQPLVDWLAENYHAFGASLEFVTDASQEGSQFVKGFGGVGALLRYKVELAFAGGEDDADADDEFYGSDEEVF